MLQSFQALANCCSTYRSQNCKFQKALSPPLVYFLAFTDLTTGPVTLLFLDLPRHANS